jgi:RNAse (barnase) inhibitor barstar
MYCVIQELQLKKPNPYGAYKNLEAYSPFAIDGKVKYGYQYTGGRFERPIKTAYKISIHESKRVNGVVTKKQYVVTTASYYSLVDCGIYDCIASPEKKIQTIADNLNADPAAVWDLIHSKVDPLQERIKAEFKKTDEYKTSAKHDKIIKVYRKAKSKFAKTYDCDENEYDYVFDVFGELMNDDYYDKIINDYKTKRSHRENNRSNYNGSGFDRNSFQREHGNLFGTDSGSYTDDEQAMLKNFYKTLSKAYHPDITNGDGKEMQLVNRLKESWGI